MLTVKLRGSFTSLGELGVEFSDSDPGRVAEALMLISHLDHRSAAVIEYPQKLNQLLGQELDQALIPGALNSDGVIASVGGLDEDLRIKIDEPF